MTNRPALRAPLLSQGGEKATHRPGFIPSLAKEGWRKAPGWFALECAHAR